MTDDEHQPTHMPQAAPREPSPWERRLHVVLTLCLPVVVLTMMALQQLHLTGTLQLLAFIVFLAAFLLFMLTGFSLIFLLARRSPPPNRLYAWEVRLLVACLFLGTLCFPWLIGDIAGIAPGWHLSRIDVRVILAVLVLMVVLGCIGTTLLIGGFIEDLWRLVRSR